MNATELTQEIRDYCRKYANAESLQKYQRYFKGGYDGYGLNTTQITTKVKEILKENKPGIQMVLEAMPELMGSKLYEETSFGLLLVDGLRKQYNRAVFERITDWFPMGITNWAHADTMAMYFLPEFLKKEIVQLSDFKDWIESPYKFQRRCVPVTFIKLLKTTDDYQAFFEFIRPLMHDKEREVHQGVGWFLREAWKLKRPETEEWLMQYKDTAPRLIFQYACEKMNKDEKLRFKKQK